LAIRGAPGGRDDQSEAEALSDNESEGEDEDEDEEEGGHWGFGTADSSDDGGEDGDSDTEQPFLGYSGRKSNRGDVELDVPCSAHSRVYRGHCNIKTVKDVNFFGLNDEYVVSGSDAGHVFIWDRKTTKLVNILEGDSEVVNVVQGKYEKSTHASFIFLSHFLPQVTPTNPLWLYQALTARSKSFPPIDTPKIRLAGVSTSSTPTIRPMSYAQTQAISADCKAASASKIAIAS
jgi:hypothetical protein